MKFSNVFLCLLLFVLFSCNAVKDEGFLNLSAVNAKSKSQNFENESFWESLTPVEINNLYWGGKPENKDDLDASFKACYDSNYVYLNIKVIDQIRYTHFIPKDSLERTLWNPDDYDQIKLFFDIKDNKNSSQNKFECKFNYGIDSVFGSADLIKNIKVVREEDSKSYGVKLRIPYKGLGLSFDTRNYIKGFNIVVSDNDNPFSKEHLDILSQWKTLLGVYFATR